MLEDIENDYDVQRQDEEGIENEFFTMFKIPPARSKPAIKIGDLVKVKGAPGMSCGLIKAIDPDGRLARVEFRGAEGWWSLFDLEKTP